TVLVSTPSGCVGRDTINVVFSSFSVDLGPDRSLCGSSTVLDAGPYAVSCQWTWNGNPLPGNSCQLTANASGTYQVIAQNFAGCSATDQIQVVLGTPLTAIMAGPSTAITGQPVQFTDQTNPPPTQRTWNFGDGSPLVSGNPSPSHTYTQAGIFPVILAVSNGLCTDTAIHLIEVLWDCSSLPLQAAFTYTPNPVDLNAGGGTVYFANTSSGATSYLWLFGTGDTSNQPNPSYAYAQPGDYTVYLIARNYNCTDTFSQVIRVVRAEPNPSTLSYSSPHRLRVYPNPVGEEAFIELPIGGYTWRVELYDGTGRAIRQWEFERGGVWRLDLRELPRGYYSLRASCWGEEPYWGCLLHE
ncbi:MAG: PKD domain-containing protein, partial [Bacteroidia bacterium]|nr:PKD domain-containing protein [Bacteroidia bacterium]